MQVAGSRRNLCIPSRFSITKESKNGLIRETLCLPERPRRGAMLATVSPEWRLSRSLKWRFATGASAYVSEP
jgi:hypothetical protein